MNSKDAVISTYIELFTRGEMLKAQQFINFCVPLELIRDKDISMLRDECNIRIDEIRHWRRGRRTDSYAYVSDAMQFPKFKLAYEKIKKTKAKKILDVGCYTGGFINYMRGKGYTCFGIDLHTELGDKGIKFGSAEDIPFKGNQFDVVTAFDVLEHVYDFESARKELNRVCRSGGLIIINLPRMTLGYKDEAFEHLRMFSDEDIKRIWGKEKKFNLELCNDELGRPTSFITYIK